MTTILTCYNVSYFSCCVEMKSTMKVKVVIDMQEGANPSTSREVLLSDHYATCHNLVLYYQMVSFSFVLLCYYCFWEKLFLN